VEDRIFQASAAVGADLRLRASEEVGGLNCLASGEEAVLILWALAEAVV
jgi:hypothetical protein